VSGRSGQRGKEDDDDHDEDWEGKGGRCAVEYLDLMFGDIEGDLRDCGPSSHDGGKSLPWRWGKICQDEEICRYEDL
jgi:hypothetical protein